jgi:hypothetical protein
MKFLDSISKVRNEHQPGSQTTFFGLVDDVSPKTVGDKDGKKVFISTINSPRGKFKVASTPWDRIGIQRARVNTGIGEADIPF